ncbi:MAG TPA: UDP-glucose 4-epimerase GalE [Caulobacteraceae bacterium]|nr:UDP-glucose 4-epimerase GalE [Caulobacteraceae bacterium]
MAGAVLVLGGAGYVGSHACKALSAAGRLPVTLDTLRTGHADAVKWGPLVEADFGDVAAVRAAVRTHEVTAVMHFAAMSLVAESVVEPALYYDRNVAGTLRLLEVLRAEGVSRIVFSSSASVYGETDRSPIPEDTPLNPTNPYGETKRVIESALRWIGGATGLSWCALRYFNAAGADPDREIGERHEPETHLIPNILRAMRARLPVKLFGADYPTPDGSTVRDYVHVSDLADAHVSALRFLEQGGASQPMNLGAGKGLSVFEIVSAAERVLGVPIPRELLGRRPGDPPSLVADITRARRVLGFEPARSDVETLIRTAAAFEAGRPHASVGG